MTLSNKAVVAMVKEAESRSELAAAMKSGAGKELVSQIKALEKAVGGKKILDQAAKVLADAETEGKRMISAARAEMQEAERTATQRQTYLEGQLRKETDDLANAKGAVTMNAQNLVGRETAVSEREAEVATVEATQAEIQAALDKQAEALTAEGTALDARQRDLDARSDRIRDAVA